MPSQKSKGLRRGPAPCDRNRKGYRRQYSRNRQQVQESPSLEAHPHGCLCRCKQQSRIIARIPGHAFQLSGLSDISSRSAVTRLCLVPLSGSCCCPPRSSPCPRHRRLLFDPRESPQRNCRANRHKILSSTVFWRTRLGQNAISPTLSRYPAGAPRRVPGHPRHGGLSAPRDRPAVPNRRVRQRE